MKTSLKIMSLLLVLLTLVALFIPQEYISRWTPQKMLRYMEGVSSDLPKLDVDFSSFGKALKSSVQILAYPLNLVIWFLVELFGFIGYFFGGLGAFFL